ncbi:preprotein translocase subunit Sec61beta [Candidatus Woesearchaeota archaeon]|nr:preprotein translocase subunit Sec61beta [Candidatus Woesearchaeota archaeon]
MAQDRITMPSGMGGLVRYFDEYKSKLEFKPGHIVALCLVVIVVLFILYSYGNRWMGLP